MTETPEKPDRTLPAILILIAVLVVVAVVVVFTRGAPKQLDTSTPEGVVQQYANAVIDGDGSTSAALLSPAWIKECAEMGYSQNDTSGLRLTHISTTVHDSSATVRVFMRVSMGAGAFGDSSYESEDSFTLVKIDGDWLIRSAPWEFTTCPIGGTDS